MSRGPGPKKLAAIAQLEKLKAQGLPDTEIRQALIEAGLTKLQARELLPLSDAEKPKEAPPIVLEPEAKAAVLNGAVLFLESIAKRIHPNAADRFPDLVAVKSDALIWARKVKAVL